MIIYDREFNDKKLSSLMYVYLTAGGRLTSDSFNNIAYKLYSYCEDLIDAENSHIEITEELKARVEDFKARANELPNPNLSEGWISLGEVSSTNGPSMMLQTEYVSMPHGEIYMFPFKFYIRETGSGNIDARIGLERLSDGYMSIVSGGITTVNAPVGAVYGRYGLNLQQSTTLSYAVIKYYDENDVEIFTKNSSSLGTGVNGNSYRFKLNYVYRATRTVDLYEYKTYNFSIDESLLGDVDASNLTLDDVYEADSIYMMKNITLGCILGKKINGENKDERYELLKSRLGEQVAGNTNLPLQYITTLKNPTTSKYYAFISDYPLMFHGNHATYGVGIGCGASVATSKIFFEVWESDDDINYVVSSVTVGGSTGASDGFKSVYNVMYITGCTEIHYSNYNIYLNFSATSGYTLPEGFARKDVGINQCYKKSDEKLTLGTIGVGATVYFGYHRVEGGLKERIPFQILDYTNNLNILAEKMTDYVKRPNDAVLLESVSIVDVLAVAAKPYTDPLIQKNNTLMHRWLNSDKGENEWFEAISENDVPPNEENMFGPTYANLRYAHRPGFLNSFTQAERDALIRCNLEDGYTGKVFLAQKGEEPYADTKVAQPSYYRYGTSVRRYKNYMNIVANHLDATKILGTDTPETKQMQYSWKRTWYSNGAYYVASTSNWNSYRDCGVVPTIYLSKDLELVETEDGLYEVVLPESETIQIEKEFDTEISIVEDVERNLSSKRQLLSEVTREFDSKYIQAVSVEKQFESSRSVTKFVFINKTINTNRNITEEWFRECSTFRKITNIQVSEYQTRRGRVHTYIRNYDSRRQVHGLMNKSFNSLRKVDCIVDKEIDAIRDVTHTFVHSAHSNRNVVETKVAIHNTKRHPAVEVSIDFDLARDIYRAEVLLFDSARDVQKEYVKEYDSKRNLASVFVKDIDSRRDVIFKTFNEFRTARSRLVNFSWEHSTIRKTNGSTVKEFNSKIVVVEDSISNYQSRRVVLNGVDKIFDSERVVAAINIVEYDSIRNALESIGLSLDSQRKLLVDSEVDFDSMREKRNVSVFEFDSERLALQNSNVEFSTKRDVETIYTGEFSSRRNIIELHSAEYDSRRNNQVISIAEYDSVRNIAGVIKIDHSSSRNVICDYINDFNVSRGVLESISKEFNTSITVLKEILIEGDVKRQVISEMLKEFDSFVNVTEERVAEYNSKREVLLTVVKEFDSMTRKGSAIMVDFDSVRETWIKETYVSMTNLDYYTKELKKKIDTYIDEMVERKLKEVLNKINEGDS